MLKLLIEQRPKALSKHELFTSLWPDTFVTENNLATLIGDLRSSLGDSAHEPRFIRTIYAYGYAFSAPAVEQHPDESALLEPSSAWKLMHEHREIALRPGENILGRTGPGVVVLDSPTISRHHAKLVISGDCATIEDLGSKNGTWVGVTAVTEPVRVNDGDELRLGSIVLRVRFRPDASSTETIDAKDA